MSDRRCVIMQPTYLPWAGYFNLIVEADEFVFLDDVQFHKPSWQNRNRVVVNGEPHWLTVPTNRSDLSDLLKDIPLDDRHNWRKKHATLIKQSYGKHPHSEELTAILNVLADESITGLCELNVKIIQAVCEELDIKFNPKFSSQLNIENSRSERLLDICKALDCPLYLSPKGSAEYLEEDAVFTGDNLVFHEYTPDEYEQKGTNSFISHLSIVDVIANIGLEKTAEYVQS